MDTASKSVQYELMTAREWQHGLYINDRWQLNDQMTLNLGLRYEYYPLMTRADRGLERLDLDTMEVLLGGVGGNPEDLGLDVGRIARNRALPCYTCAARPTQPPPLSSHCHPGNLR